jgi:hypothetical protein
VANSRRPAGLQSPCLAVISNYERGAFRLYGYHIVRIADVLGVTAEYLVGRDSTSKRGSGPRRPPGELLGEINEEQLVDVCGWAFVLWCRLRDLEQRLAERIAVAYLLPQLQQDGHQDPHGDPQDRPDGHGSSRVVGLEEAADGAHPENRDSEHQRHADHAENEPAGLRIEVVQSPTLWPVRRGGTRR